MIKQFIRSLPNINFIIIKSINKDYIICDKVTQYRFTYQIYKNQKLQGMSMGKDDEWVDVNDLSESNKRTLLSKIFYMEMSIIK